MWSLARSYPKKHAEWKGAAENETNSPDSGRLSSVGVKAVVGPEAGGVLAGDWEKPLAYEA